MIRRILGMAGAMLFLAVASGNVEAESPEGPRLAYAKFSFSPAKLELLTAGPSGESPMKVAGGDFRSRPLPYPYDVPAWLPDGSQFVFSAYIGRFGPERPRTALFIASADGSGAREIPGTRGALHPTLSPNGHTVAFAREKKRKRPNGRGGEKTVYESVSIWAIDLIAGGARRITPWRNRLVQVPSSFSSDGTVLAVTRSVADKTPEAIGLSFDGSGSALLARNAIEPVFSPDGSQMAFLRGHRRTARRGDSTFKATFTDIYVSNTRGGGLSRLTKTPAAAEVSPQWDPSGQRLAYTEINLSGSGEALLGFGTSLMEINTDGSCRIKVLSFRRAVLFGASWQPGPGREAGRISC